MKPRKIQKGFTLVETIVASTILCGSVITITAICTNALTNTRLNRQYEAALSLVDRQLSLIDYIGIDEFLELGALEGEFDEYEPIYYFNGFLISSLLSSVCPQPHYGHEKCMLHVFPNTGRH